MCQERTAIQVNDGFALLFLDGWAREFQNARVFIISEEIFQEILGALDNLWVKISSHGVRSGWTSIFAAEAGCWCWFRWWPLLRHHWTSRGTRRCSTEEEEMCTRGGNPADCALGPGAQRFGAYRHQKGERCRLEYCVPWQFWYDRIKNGIDQTHVVHIHIHTLLGIHTYVMYMHVVIM